MKIVQKYTIVKKKKSLYISANLKLNNKIHFVTTKQRLRTIAVLHAEQLSQHTNSIKNRGRQAAIHTMKHEFLIDNCMVSYEQSVQQ